MHARAGRRRHRRSAGGGRRRGHRPCRDHRRRPRDRQRLRPRRRGDRSSATVEAPHTARRSSPRRRTVSYTPDAGFVGVDRSSTRSSTATATRRTATVTVELARADAVNQAPRWSTTRSTTSESMPVVVEVLANDLDPERDLLRIGEFAIVTGDGARCPETVGRDGLPALHFVPAPGFSGTGDVDLRAEDVLGAVSEPATVSVDVAAAGGRQPPAGRPSRTPYACVAISRPRSRCSPTTWIPTATRCRYRLVGPSPEGVDVNVEGDVLAHHRPGRCRRPGAVLVRGRRRQRRHRGRARARAGRGREEPNQPPLVNADTATVVLGRTVDVDVRANDIDPDGDPLVVVGVGKPDLGRAAAWSGNKVLYTPAGRPPPDRRGPFTYTVGDGVRPRGDRRRVAVHVLPSPRPSRRGRATTRRRRTSTSRSTSTCCANDGDSSGILPGLAGDPSCPPGATATVTAVATVRFVPAAGGGRRVPLPYDIVNRRSDGVRRHRRQRAGATGGQPAARRRRRGGHRRHRRCRRGRRAGQRHRPRRGRRTAQRGVVVGARRSVRPPADGGVITYRAPAAPGVATIRYDVVDAAGAVSVGRLTVRVVEPAPVAPIAADDVRTIAVAGRRHRLRRARATTSTRTPRPG